ncbi:MAG: tyrosine-type recombinase/integrase [Rhodothermales bacterium]|nr:tyrosine-type recombinase/integrase [Rhodothermales bacterium]MBO6781457.1 tyrosine-type recombinase/integrase [Rhodothermales bacterium]
MASLFKRRGNWHAQFFSAERSPARKRVRIQATGKREAERVFSKMLVAYGEGAWDPWSSPQWPPNPSHDLDLPSVGCASQAFLDSREGLREATRKHYRWVLNLFVEYVGPNEPLGRLCARSVGNWLASNAKRSEATRNTYLTRLRVWGRWLKSKGYDDFTEGVALSSPPERLPSKVITTEQARALAEAARIVGPDYLSGVILVTHLLALRLGEVCAMTAEWLDHTDQTVVVQSGGAFTTKSGRVVRKPATEEAWAILSAASERHLAGPLFRNSRGNALNPKWTSKQFKRLVRRCGMPETFTFHGLRHGALTELAKQGVNMDLIRRFAGHSTMDMTLRYVHLDSSVLAKEVRSALTSSGVQDTRSPRTRR